jgi:hypothetical protein
MRDVQGQKIHEKEKSPKLPKYQKKSEKKNKRKGRDASEKHVSWLHVGSSARSLPFRIGVEESSVPRESGEHGNTAGWRVGVLGGDEGSPDAASVRRNSTQRREKDCVTLQTCG